MITKGQEEACGGNGYVHYLDCGDGSQVYTSMSKLLKVYTSHVQIIVQHYMYLDNAFFKNLILGQILD